MSNQLNHRSLKTRWVMRRNAILGSARFQRWATRTPIVRGIARRRAAAQFDLVAGFVYSQILLAHVDSGLIDLLTGELRSSGEISDRLGLDSEATQRLLWAGAALQLVEELQPGWWTLGEAGAPLSSNAGVMAMIRHHRLLYSDLADPLALLAAGRRQETALSAFWTYASKAELCSGEGRSAGDGEPGAGSRLTAVRPSPDHERTVSAQPYSALMAATQPMVAQQILDAFDFGRYRKMLDIGGGSGAFTQTVLAATPGLACGIFDLPEVVATAQARFADSALATRVSLHSGSFKTDPLPAGYDLMTLVRIAHDHDDEVVADLFARIHAALPPRGRLLTVEPMAEEASAPRMGDAYFGLYLWAMGSGRPRSAGELSAMLATAGFARVRAIPTALPLVTSALLATK